MKVLVVGGGSGGHITPAVAVVRELIALKPRCRVEFWTDRKYYKNVTRLATEIGMRWGEEGTPMAGKKTGAYIRVRRVAAGKFHRYAGWRWRDYFEHLDVTFRDLIWGNIVGFFGFCSGFVVSFGRLLPRRRRPDVIFLKGGFVGLPVGLAARIFRIPYVVHESDAVPGLANRILMKRARVVAYGMKPEVESEREVWTGVPVAEEFAPVSEARQRSLKKAFGFDVERPLVVVTGGSQGAQALDEAMREIVPELLKVCSVGLVAGRKHYEDMIDLKRYEEWDKAELKSNFRMWEFCTTMDELMGAADVVVSRAGATTIAELSALGKAVILVPFERLPGGHQVKNAERLVEAGAVKMILNRAMTEKPELLLDELRHLVRSPRERADLAARLHAEARPGAAAELARILIEVAA